MFDPCENIVVLETYSHLQICLDGPCWARTSIKCRHRDIRAKDKCNLVLVDHGGVDTSCTYVAFHPLLTPLVWVYLHSGRRLLYSSSQPGRRAYKTPTRARVWLLLHLAFFGLRSTIRSPHLRPRHAPETEPLIYYLTPEHLFLPKYPSGMRVLVGRLPLRCLARPPPVLRPPLLCRYTSIRLQSTQASPQTQQSQEPPRTKTPSTGLIAVEHDSGRARHLSWSDSGEVQTEWKDIAAGVEDTKPSTPSIGSSVIGRFTSWLRQMFLPTNYPQSVHVS